MKKILYYILFITLFIITINGAYAYDNKYESTITSDYIEWDSNNDGGNYYVNGSTTPQNCPYVGVGETLDFMAIIQETTDGFLVICGESSSSSAYGGGRYYKTGTSIYFSFGYQNLSLYAYENSKFYSKGSSTFK